MKIWPVEAEKMLIIVQNQAAQNLRFFDIVQIVKRSMRRKCNKRKQTWTMLLRKNWDLFSFKFDIYLSKLDKDTILVLINIFNSLKKYFNGY